MEGEQNHGKSNVISTTPIDAYFCQSVHLTNYVFNIRVFFSFLFVVEIYTLK